MSNCRRWKTWDGRDPNPRNLSAGRSMWGPLSKMNFSLPTYSTWWPTRINAKQLAAFSSLYNDRWEDFVSGGKTVSDSLWWGNYLLIDQLRGIRTVRLTIGFVSVLDADELDDGAVPVVVRDVAGRSPRSNRPGADRLTTCEKLGGAQCQLGRNLLNGLLI